MLQVRPFNREIFHSLHPAECRAQNAGDVVKNCLLAVGIVGSPQVRYLSAQSKASKDTFEPPAVQLCLAVANLSSKNNFLRLLFCEPLFERSHKTNRLHPIEGINLSASASVFFSCLYVLFMIEALCAGVTLTF
jgi:hypothetical protein